MKAEYSFDIKCQENGKCCFRLLPNNNKEQQPMGISVPYDTPKECYTALQEFKKLIHNDPNQDCVKLVDEVVNGRQSYRYEIYNLNGDLVFYRGTPCYSDKAERKRGINRVYEHIDADLKE